MKETDSINDWGNDISEIVSRTGMVISGSPVLSQSPQKSVYFDLHSIHRYKTVANIVSYPADEVFPLLHISLP